MLDTGYRFDLENRDELAATSRPVEELLLVAAADAPAELDPRPWHRIENQQKMGSCQGHALSSVCEMAYRIACLDGGLPPQESVIQFSPMFAYLTSQEEDGIRGRDEGSTLSGGRKAAMKYGSCPLEFFPYPPRYTPNIPAECFDHAKPFKIQSSTIVRSYRDAFAFLASGQGGVEIGIMWPEEWMNVRGPQPLETYRSGRSSGGHAVCFLGYSRREDSQGRKYLWLANSWEGWGDAGWKEVAPQAVDQMATSEYNVMLGLSDLTTPKVRRVNWTGEGSVFT